MTSHNARRGFTVVQGGGGTSTSPAAPRRQLTSHSPDRLMNFLAENTEIDKASEFGKEVRALMSVFSQGARVELRNGEGGEEPVLRAFLVGEKTESASTRDALLAKVSFGEIRDSLNIHLLCRSPQMKDSIDRGVAGAYSIGSKSFEWKAGHEEVMKGTYTRVGMRDDPDQTGISFVLSAAEGSSDLSVTFTVRPELFDRLMAGAEVEVNARAKAKELAEVRSNLRIVREGRDASGGMEL